jgi:hypothetical protein
VQTGQSLLCTVLTLGQINKKFSNFLFLHRHRSRYAAVVVADGPACDEAVAAADTPVVV